MLKASCHAYFGFTPNKAQAYPSEQAAVEQEKLKNQLATMSAKLNVFDNKKIYAFRATGAKNSWSSPSIRTTFNPGTMWWYLFVSYSMRHTVWLIYYIYLCKYNISDRFLILFTIFVLEYANWFKHFFKLFGKILNTILETY